MTTYEKIMSVIAEPMGWLLSLLYNFIGNYGITLIVFTLLVRGCLFPLYAAQIKSSVRMKDVQPKIQALQKKYANDRETMNIKMMELYREENFNPMRGCLPMLIQMPIILALFVLLRNPIAFMSNKQMLMAVHESFLWVPDLSQPDPWILPVLAGIATFFSFSLTQALSAPSGDLGSTAGMMKMMKFFFPVMIVWMGRSFPAGLTLYWFIGTLFMICQTFGMRKWRKSYEKKAVKSNA
ncbi:MAG: YidC/Oxa1 family membrane protein insertase [Anaerovoracaceae bacterium]|jgi:YidC/Oxa1 family membrane protein insertase